MTQDSTQDEQTQSPDPAAPTAADVPVVATDGPDVFCPYCEYNLRGAPSNRCPECGKEFDPATLLVSRVPWTQRQKHGRIMAFVGTVAMVTFRPGRLARAVECPAGYKDARLFRWPLIVFVSAWLVLLEIKLGLGEELVALVVESELSNLLWRIGFWTFATVVSLVVITALPSWFAAPKRMPVERQNRAIALSYYATAPLVCLWLPILILMGVIEGVMSSRPANPEETAAVVLAFILATAILIQTWVTAAWSISRFSERKPLGLVGIALSLLVLWVVLPVVVVVLPLLAWIYGTLMYYSLTA